MRICVDLDGVICELKPAGASYADLAPVDGAVRKLRTLKAAGHYIIIFTARRMRTHNGNISRVVADVGKITLDWLERHDVPYDEILFGKPWADVYIDDNALRFHDWSRIDDSGANLPASRETAGNANRRSSTDPWSVK
ncbi:MAG: capsular biosynthesis protein [Gammaproteobacteria bacterium]|nr:capsular biosynthesis protein [Gammaproteobacteria bacterium]